MFEIIFTKIPKLDVKFHAKIACQNTELYIAKIALYNSKTNFLNCDAALARFCGISRDPRKGL